MASSINPNNIDGSYPVAGQDNNSQGFRDNFTNIKVNFQYAEDEINDLDSKVLLKAALTGTTLDNNMDNNTIYAVNLNDVSTTRVALANTSGSVSVNYASGQYQTIAPSAGSINVSVTNWPAAGYYGCTRLAITVSNVAYTVTFNAGTTLLGTTGLEGYTSISAASGYITFAATGVYVFDLSTSDGGSTVTITDLSRPLTAFTGSAITGASVSVTGNVTGGNVNTGGLITATGNITGGNILTAGLSSVTGNITGGNFLTAGLVSATGNLLGANVVSTGYGSFANGMIGISTYGGAFSDGIVVDYLTGNGRISVGSSDGLNIYNGGVANTLLVNIGTGGAIKAIGAITSNSASGGVGYSSGAGGTVTQSTSKATGVTLSKVTGQITTASDNLASATTVSFTFTNTTLAAGDLLVINHISGGTIGGYSFNASCTNGSATVYIRNLTNGGLAEALVLGFAVIKAVTA